MHSSVPLRTRLCRTAWRWTAAPTSTSPSSTRGLYHDQSGGAPSGHRPGNHHLRRCRTALNLCSHYALLGNHQHGHTRSPRRPCLRQERQPLHRRFKQQLRARDRRTDHSPDGGWAMRQRPHRQRRDRPQQSLRAGLLGGRLAVYLGVRHRPQQCGRLQLRNQRPVPHRRPLQRGLRPVQRLAGGPGCLAGSPRTSRSASPPTPAETSTWPIRRTTLCASWAPTWPSRQPMSDRSVRTRPSSSASIRR